MQERLCIFLSNAKCHSTYHWERYKIDNVKDNWSWRKYVEIVTSWSFHSLAAGVMVTSNSILVPFNLSSCLWDPFYFSTLAQHKVECNLNHKGSFTALWRYCTQYHNAGWCSQQNFSLHICVSVKAHHQSKKYPFLP